MKYNEVLFAVNIELNATESVRNFKWKLSFRNSNFRSFWSMVSQRQPEEAKTNRRAVSNQKELRFDAHGTRT